MLDNTVEDSTCFICICSHQRTFKKEKAQYFYFDDISNLYRMQADAIIVSDFSDLHHKQRHVTVNCVLSVAFGFD